MKRAAAAALAVVIAAALWFWLRPRFSEATHAQASPSQAGKSAEAPGPRDASVLPPPDRRAQPATAAGGADAGVAAQPNAADPSVFGGIVGLHNSFAVAEALSKNAATAEARVNELCEKSRQLRSKPSRASGERDAAQFMAPLMDYEEPLD